MCDFFTRTNLGVTQLVPNTKLYLSTVPASSAGGYSFLPNATGDFTATLTGDPIAPWAAGITDLNGDLRPDLDHWRCR